ncbi:MAG TPA: hypothetical protein VF625_15740 [Longimicrobium sp.]|jgi:hypothetical protein
MPESAWKWDPREVRALLFLSRVADARGGYTLRGVRGWAHLDDVKMATGGGLFEVLPLLHQRGLLDREDARPPGRALPAWVYRVSDAGVRAAHRLAGTEYQPLPRLRGGLTPAVYMPERQRGALLLLRAARDDSAIPLRFGERGWLTGRELGARVDAQNRERRSPRFLAVDATDLRWLLRYGLIERRAEAPRPGREREIVHWRATEMGRAIALLEWRATRADRE